MLKNEKIVPRSTNFADWYTSVINEAKLIKYTDIKGFMIFEPRGWSIWERIKEILDKKFKSIGVKNVYMPLLIPISEFKKEKDHIEGFAPELFTVTRIGEKKLEDELAIRPTSEIWFCKYFNLSVKSYKDLPLICNQWTSVLRAEKNTRAFLRNSEFHWHEVHAVFETFDDANNFSKNFLDLYADFCEKDLCIPVVKGQKTNIEKFAGADITYTIESMMQDGQALQSGTSHVLGQNFAKPYDIKFQDKNNTLQYVWQTSQGLTTRIIGSIIMVHGDDKGLVLPFSIADVQIKIICLSAQKKPEVLQYANDIYNRLSNIYRCEIVNSDKGLGYLLSESETQGTPINIIIGEKDLDSKTFTYVRRDDEVKNVCNINDLEKEILVAKQMFEQNIYQRAKQKLDNNIIEVDNFKDFETVIKNQQWAKVYFADNDEIERQIKELTGATARCIVELNSKQTKPCFYTNQPCNRVVIFARAY